MREFTDESLRRLRALLEQRPGDEIELNGLRRACVVIPLVPTAQGWSILFAKRSETLALHRGQVAFPGGSVEPDEALEDAAVRETEEEVGISRSAVELIGRLDDLVTHTGFLVAPFVGVIPPGLEYVMQPSEVVEIFEVPLSSLLAPGNPEVRYVTYRLGQYPTYFYHYGSTEIWGLTGRIVKSFLDIVHLVI